MLRDQGFYRDLADPPKPYRPVPFWSWNERLDTAETRRQIAEMDAVGIGGYFMHARGGLQTEYMGTEWMENISAGIDEARTRGMEAWAYDENGWPSGFGDGMVNGLGEAYQQKYLRYREGTHDFGSRGIGGCTLPDGRTLSFYYDVNPFYVDTLDPEVTRVFLERVYEPYAARFKGDFGGAMPGFFTDEPQVSRAGIPWSLILPGKYAETHGEDLLPLLPQLFLETGDWKRTRYRFWKLVQELFVTSFTQQIHDWLEARGARLTGHMVLEETLHSQITSNGAVMPHYEFFHIPGMDWLCRHIDPPATPLQVASVAHQLGKPDILSETFALTGWNVTFEELKWMYEWQMVRGITRLCQHLEGYSLRGIRKRDYPPSLFYQQPWWAEDYKPFNDAMSRVGMLLSKGKPGFDVLLVHPQSSAWIHYDEGKNPGLWELDGDFRRITDLLEASHIPFHYGDERIMKRHGRVDGDKLVVGTQSYVAVIVPSTDTLDESTVRLLQGFAEAGGTLLWAGRKPSLMEGAPSAAIDALAALGHGLDPSDIRGSLPAGAGSIRVTGTDGAEIGRIAATSRILPSAGGHGDGGRFVFLANADDSRDYDAIVSVPGGDVRIIDILSGDLLGVPHTVANGTVTLTHRFHRRGSLALLVSDSPGVLPATAALVGDGIEDGVPVPLDGPWELELMDPNAITLDYCDILFDGETVAENEHISIVQSRALALERPVDISLGFTIECAEGYTPEGPVHLVMEQPSMYRIELNGIDIPNTDCGMYRDASFRKVDISGGLVPGINRLWLHIRFEQGERVLEDYRKSFAFESEKNKLTYDTEVEAVYLIGNFGVAVKAGHEELPRDATRCGGGFTLVPLPTAVTLGDLTYQGLPFFNGTVSLTKRLTLAEDEIRGRTLALSKAMTQVVKLDVNGSRVKTWYWRPYTASLEGLLTEGENTLRLTLTSGLRNLLGPHHLEEGESYAVAPSCFFKEPNIWGNQPWNDGYCFVRFGVWS